MEHGGWDLAAGAAGRGTRGGDAAMTVEQYGPLCGRGALIVRGQVIFAIGR